MYAYVVQALIALVISYVITIVFAPKMQPPVPEAFEELDFPQTDEGTAQSVVFGDCWIEDFTILGLGNYRTTKVKRKSGK